MRLKACLLRLDKEGAMHVSHVAFFRVDRDVKVLYPTQFLISNLDHVFVTQA